MTIVQTMGIVAHPGEVTCVDVSCDGRYLFSAGGFDLSVNMWRIDVPAGQGHNSHAVMPGTGGEPSSLTPYFTLLEGGEGGELHKDLVDYFYYCQLRHSGEDSMEARNLTGYQYLIVAFELRNQTYERTNELIN